MDNLKHRQPVICFMKDGPENFTVEYENSISKALLHCSIRKKKQ